MMPAIADRSRHSPPRVAYFPDAFHEVNGVAHTSRQFEAFARRRNLPFLCIRAGPANIAETAGSVRTLELPRGTLSFLLEKDLRFDVAFWRHLPRVLTELRHFRPDIIHITGPSELGLLGAWFAHRLKVPLAASWHTNVHEYAAMRSQWLTKMGLNLSRGIESAALWAALRHYRQARVLFAPNLALCGLLENATGRPCRLMTRGVDADAFSPAYRTRPRDDFDFVLGFVGRLSAEKNVALLVAIEQQLRRMASGQRFRFLIVGQGGEEAWLRERLVHAEFTGVLHGQALARAYADMDVFVFPSHTDTFGNVVLEALASGVPCVVTPDGGPAHIVREGETGFIGHDDQFSNAIAALAAAPDMARTMRKSARQYALSASWDSVFEGVYSQYAATLCDDAARCCSAIRESRPYKHRTAEGSQRRVMQGR